MTQANLERSRQMRNDYIASSPIGVTMGDIMRWWWNNPEMPLFGLNSNPFDDLMEFPPAGLILTNTKRFSFKETTSPVK